MKTTHLRFTSPCQCRIYAEEAFYGTPFQEEGQLLDSFKTAHLYERYSDLSIFLNHEQEEVTEFLDSKFIEKTDVVKMLLGDYGVFNGEFCLVHHVWVKGQLDEISEDAISEIQDYISGQLSDGWGESLEQISWMEDQIHWTVPYFDEYTLEWEEEERSSEVSYNLEPWGRGVFVTYMDNEPCELAIEAELVATMERKDDKFTRLVLHAHSEPELYAVLEELKCKNPDRVGECIREYGYPMLLAFNKYFDTAGMDFVFYDKAFAVNGVNREYIVKTIYNYSEENKRLRFYDAITELLKA